MLDTDEMDVSIDPPHLVVEVPMTAPMDATMELEYELDEVLQFDSEEVSIVDSHWHGVVVEGPDGETEHIDLRDVRELNGEGNE